MTASYDAHDALAKIQRDLELAQERATRAARAQGEIALVRGTARGPRGDVTAEVDANGLLTDLHLTEEALLHALKISPRDLGLRLVYDVAHNIAKIEEHEVGGRRRKLCVHRKGATRAFPAGHPDVPEQYRHIGQPVIIPGDMGRASWMLLGQPGSMEKPFGTTCHGAGRVMSSTAAIKHAEGRRIDRELAEHGIIAKCRSWKGLAEEQPAAYKDVDVVVDVVHRAGLASKVARLRPLGVVKG